MSISKKWFKPGYTDKDKRKVLDSIVKASDAFELLTDLIDKKIRVKKRESRTDYETVNWALKQADYVGYSRALDEILELLTTNQE